MTRTYTFNLLSVLIVPLLLLLAIGVIPFTAVSVVAAIVISHGELNVSWTR